MKEILVNLKKYSGRTYTKNYVDEKLSEVNGIWEKIQNSEDTEDLVEAKRVFDELAGQIKTCLIVKDSDSSDNIEQVIDSKYPRIRWGL